MSGEPKACAHCGQLQSPQNYILPGSGLCNRCHQYQLRTGRPRPEYLFNRPFVGAAACNNCGRDDSQIISGLCPACRTHLKRRGEPRPPLTVKLTKDMFFKLKSVAEQYLLSEEEMVFRLIDLAYGEDIIHE
jgi:hypothetical protein